MHPTFNIAIAYPGHPGGDLNDQERVRSASASGWKVGARGVQRDATTRSKSRMTRPAA